MGPRKNKATSEDDIDDEDYRKKRDRNNQAVKKSRFKSKQKTVETVTRINKLKAENEELEQKVQTLTKQLGFLKELFISHSANTPNGKFEGIDLEKLLNDPDDDIPPPRKGR